MTTEQSKTKTRAPRANAKAATSKKPAAKTVTKARAKTAPPSKMDAPSGRPKSAIKDATEIKKRSDAQVLEAFNQPQMSESAKLLAKFAADPSVLSEREWAQLHASGLLDQLSHQVDQHKEKRVLPEEINELKMQELTLQEIHRRIGSMHVQVAELTRQASVMMQRREHFLAEIGEKYRVEKNCHWVVDLDTGKIVIKERLPEQP